MPFKKEKDRKTPLKNREFLRILKKASATLFVYWKAWRFEGEIEKTGFKSYSFKCSNAATSSTRHASHAGLARAATIVHSLTP